MLIYIEIKSLFCFPNNSLNEKCQKTTQAILRCTNTFGMVVYFEYTGQGCMHPSHKKSRMGVGGAMVGLGIVDAV